MTRTPHGSISICTKGDRLRLQFPRSWYEGEQKYFALRLPNTSDNLLYAANLARQIEWDYLQNTFDRTFANYTPQQPEITKDLSLEKLWEEYCRYKSKSVKPATIHYLTNGLGLHIANCPHQDPRQGLEVREWLLSHTTPNMSRRIIAALATAITWGIKHDKVTISTNPFVGMSADIRVNKTDAAPNAFSPEEQELVINGFVESRRYSFYAPLVKFWLFTGCRPSEAIGLTWGQITDDCSRIRFDRSLIHICGRPVVNNRSKTNRIRTFQSNEVLREFLLDHRDRRAENTPLVFPSPTGKPIDYSNFSIRAWDKTVDPLINRPSTPYSCRDTFITNQIAKGIPIAVVARWCDNSVKTIERHYFDLSALADLKPR
jgi:integrase